MDQFIARVEQLKFGLGDEDIADALWLARHMGVSGGSESVDDELGQSGNDSTPTEGDRGQDASGVETVQPSDSMDVFETVEEEGESPFSVFASDTVTQSPDESSPDQGVPFQAPAATALPNALELGRSLRPLMRKVPSAIDSVLDSDATVNRIIEQDNWHPVLRPAPERWLDLELVIESFTVSFVWEDVIRDFKTKVLERQGAFRSIRTWTLRQEDGQPCLIAQSGGAVGKRRGHPRELVHPSGRRLIMVLSDMRSPLWYQHGYPKGDQEAPDERSAEGSAQPENNDSPQMYHWLDYWGKKGPVVLVQLLPEWLWERSALDFGLDSQLGSVGPGAANQLWRLEGLTPRQRRLVGGDNALKIPVVTFDVDTLNDWARAVAGLGLSQVPGVVFNLANMGQLQHDHQVEVEQQGEFAPDVLVDRFLGTASSTAQQLAGMMASVPVSVSVVHLIQSELLRNSTPVHVAEVFMSKLIGPVGINQRTHQPIYDFCHPEIRTLLIQALPTTTTHQVITALSAALGRKLREGSITSFAAFLAPERDWLDQGDDDERIVARFAELLPDVLRTMGGAYETLAESATVLKQTTQVLRRQADVTDVVDIVEVEDKAESPFPFQMLEFDTARFSEVSSNAGFPELQQRSFKVVQLSVGLKPSNVFVADENPGLDVIPFKWLTFERNLFRRWIIKRHPGQYQQYRERLNQDIALDMVSIPSGVFMMGEGNQAHQVRVPPFYMGKYPVTQAQWKIVASMERVQRDLKPKPSYFEGHDLPVESVSWEDAVEFCQRLSTHTQREYRLPSEAEWEYACRAGTTTAFHFGDMVTTDIANYDGSPYENGPHGKDRHTTVAVGSLNAPNKFGLYDMHGNVWEWCQDHWHESYKGAPSDGSAWLENTLQNNRRVVRGGSWYGKPRNCRSAYRYYDSPVNRDPFIGLRVAVSAPGLSNS